ncbi:MAG TPA: 4Fe-4S binding protein [Elusimicrobiales bacterium]|nr:4Fe-4S binding protein [Elusimicrobiales bacterium]
MKQVLILSGKGGTGKTTVAGAFARLAAPCVCADCDVDAADLHIILSPAPVERSNFYGGKKASIDPAKCVSCGRCLEVCRFGAIVSSPFRVNETSCEGCGVCVWNCNIGAINFNKVLSGTLAISGCRFGNAFFRQSSRGNPTFAPVVSNRLISSPARRGCPGRLS